MSVSNHLVRLLYDAILGREPDPDGLASWSDLIDNGIAARDLVPMILDSEEAQFRAASRSWFRDDVGIRPFWSSELAEAAHGLAVTDVGAAPLDYQEDIYGKLLLLPGARLTCFEPSPERASAVLEKHPGANVVEACVADGQRRTFYETHAGVTSSLYRPNPRAEIDLAEIQDEMHIADVSPVDTVRLDDVPQARGTHFLKLDVQAAERDVLRNGTEVLQGSLAVHCELEFFPLYADQPLGWEVWRELDQAGFDLFWFHHLQPYQMRSTLNARRAVPKRLGWGDAVFFPKTERLFELDVGDCLKLCAIWHDVYGAADHCRWLLEHHPSAEVRAVAPAYGQLAVG